MSPQKRPAARELLTDTSEQLLATVFAGQVRAVVIERALRQMAEAAAQQRRTPDQRAGGRP